MTPLFDPVIALLIEKLADGNGRVRDGGKKGLDCISASPHVGPAAVCAHAVRALPPKQKTAWRPIAARLDLLYSLVAEFGLGGSSGLSADTVLGFSKNHGAYQHSTLEVRDAAKKLVVTIQKLAGTPAVQSTLNLLRPKQLEEYNAAFLGEDPISGPNAVANAGPGPGASKKVTAGAKGEPPSPARVDKHLQHATHAPGGKVPTSAAKAAAKHDDLRHSHQGNGAKHAHGEDEEGAPDYTSCMFCGVRDKTWTENDLDVHYWKDCPLLISCPSCAQIVEIAGLPEHLLDECDEKDTYVPCETTGKSFCIFFVFPFSCDMYMCWNTTYIFSIKKISFLNCIIIYSHLPQVWRSKRTTSPSGRKDPTASLRLRTACTVHCVWPLWKIATRPGWRT